MTGSIEAGAKVIIPGSYDPATVGHVALFERAARLFGEVYAVICVNTEKRSSGFFTPEERLVLLDASVFGIPNVKTGICEGLLADYMRQNCIYTLVKGVRNTVDFEYERELAAIMKTFDSRFDTVLIPSDAATAHISSTYARDLIKYHCSLEEALTGKAAALVRKLRQ